MPDYPTLPATLQCACGFYVHIPDAGGQAMRPGEWRRHKRMLRHVQRNPDCEVISLWGDRPPNKREAARMEAALRKPKPLRPKSQTKQLSLL